jgi:alkylation response protein AidB-like acyl-CoA dehydrogenase
MTFVWSEDQDQLAAAVRALLSISIETGADALTGPEASVGGRTWRRLCTEVGAYAIGIPESFGGAGFGFSYQAVVFAETGRALAPRGLFSTLALAAPALLLSRDRERCAEWLPQLADGTAAATLAVTESTATSLNTSAVLTRGEWRLSGRKTFVTDAGEARLLLVSAATDAGQRLFAVDSSADGLTIDLPECLDMTRPLATLRLDRAPATPVGAAGEAGNIISSVRQRAAVALAFEQVAGAARCLEMAAEYASIRSQFGRPIGTFQAIKHLLADVLVAIECAAAAAQHAAAAVDRDDDAELAQAVPVAQILASEAYTAAAGANIQVHGGIGFTWDHPAHLFFKRATVSKAFLGSPADHRETLAARAFARKNNVPAPGYARKQLLES